MTESAGVSQAVENMVTEARQLRAPSDLPSLESGPGVVWEHLVAIRTRLDRIEELLSRTIRVRTKVRAQAKTAAAEVEDAWAAQVGRSPSRKQASFGGPGDQAPRERYADADLAVLEQRRAQRQVQGLADQVEDAVEVIRMTHRGLDSMRMDLHTMMRSFSVGSSLER